MNRRTVLKGGAILAVTAHTAASASDLPKELISVDDFLSTALPDEKARYHANALAEAMNEMRPGAYIVRLVPKHGFAFVVDGDQPKVLEGQPDFEQDYWERKQQLAQEFEAKL